MVDEVEEVANPYNQRKPWHTEEQEERGFISADDSLFYQAPSEEVVEESDTEDPTTAEATPDVDDELPQEEPSSKYKKVDYKKRYDDLKRHYDKKLQEFKSERQKLVEAARQSRPHYTPPKTPEELATLREEAPEDFAVIESVAHIRAQEMFSELQEKIDVLEKESQKLKYDKAKAELLQLQPDFEKITKSDEFHEWAQQQPEEIQGWVYRNGTNVSLASRAIDLFKRDTNYSAEKEKPEKESKPSAADVVAVKAKTKPEAKEKKVWTRSEIANLSVEQYDKLAKEIDQAFIEGRVVNG